MKRLFALLLAIVILFSVSACSFSFGNTDDPVDDPGSNVEDPGDDPGEEPGEDPGEDPGDDPGTDPGEAGTGVEGDFYSYEGDNAAFLMLLDFQELQFNFTQGYDGEESSYTYTHVYAGDDEVDGVPAKKFDITIVEDGETVESEVWINSSGEMLKAGADGSYATGEMASIYALGCVIYSIPFYAYTGAYAETFVDGEFTGYGWGLKKQSTERRDFGDGNVQVERYVFNYNWMEEDSEFIWEIAKIDGKNVFTKWSIDDDGELTDMNVERIIPF